MNDSTSRILALIKQYSSYPHILIPRRGHCIFRSLNAIGVDSIVLWRYYDAPSTLDDPSVNFTQPTLPISVGESLSNDLELAWNSEAYGVGFPEMLYLPTFTPDTTYVCLSRLCKQYRHNDPPPDKYITGIRKTLVSLSWAIAPLTIAPHMHDSASDYCLLLSNDPLIIGLVELAMSDFDVRTFKLTHGSNQWPIPTEA